jgi:uncharacterized membrane protein
MLTNLINALIRGIATLVDFINVLPTSPFQSINAVMVDSQVLAFIAWFVPFEAIIGLLQAWIAAIITWYISKKALRWMKLIQ